MAEAFNKMTGDLKAHIATLEQVTKEKERVESGLRVANKIQASMLPRIFPPFPEIENLVRELIRGMRETVAGFTREAPAWDDITMLAVTLGGPASGHGAVAEGARNAVS